MLQAPQGRVRHAARGSPSAMRRLGHDGPRMPHALHPERRTVCDVQRVRKQKTSDARRVRHMRTAQSVRHARHARRIGRSSCSSCRTPCDAKLRAVRRAVCPGKIERRASHATHAMPAERTASAPKTRCTVGSHASSTSYTPWSIVVARGRTTRVPWRTV